MDGKEFSEQTLVNPPGFRATSDQGESLRIGRTQERTRVLGPGVRCAIWFQGCALRCPGCIASAMNDSAPLFFTSAELLSDWALSIEGIEGVTLSGGDPFDQPLNELAEFLERVRTHSALSVLCYTGRTLAQLRGLSDPAVARALRSIDILIDGPYVETLNDGVGWRGSSNQVIHVLGDRAVGAEDGAAVQRGFELNINPGGTVGFTGLPIRGRGRELSQRLEIATHAIK